ncbi:flagellar basal body-associated FliL family protein [Natronospira bacteriovora]|uniref:Flagellar protein FliL n=1 Tax=Natronospira bacteriovora TaxID=3069753 RepID=A0ABU0W3I7_9GAMM|nr:flagellar basal body-associated FliL family protein [Natronospira sp. AB-CW4]MDQ2068468.1 flagellar basal body-associated FliL family protein [Natronospira sp. AB-CW4]
MKAWILGGIGIVLVLLIGLGTGLFLAGALDGNGNGGAENAVPAAVEEMRQPPIYYAIEPAFVVNVEAERRVRYLQVKVELMSRDQASLDAVERHMPRVRNRLLMLFSDVEFEKARSAAGREALQDEALRQIVELLEEEEEPSDIEALFFTNFVMQ